MKYWLILIVMTLWTHRSCIRNMANLAKRSRALFISKKKSSVHTFNFTTTKAGSHDSQPVLTGGSIRKYQQN